MKYTLCKRKKELLTRLGKPYTTKVIDKENCVYRDLGNYEIEISGGKNNRKFTIFAWEKSPVLRVVEDYHGVEPDFPTVKALLDDICSRCNGGFIEKEEEPGETIIVRAATLARLREKIFEKMVHGYRRVPGIKMSFDGDGRCWVLMIRYADAKTSAKVPCPVCGGTNCFDHVLVGDYGLPRSIPK